MGIGRYVPAPLKPAVRRARVALITALLHGGDRLAAKEAAELKFWRTQAAAEGGELSNGHYEMYFTQPFDLKPEDFRGKRILDIGCGPRGSLEWIEDAMERIGLDTLVDQYRDLGIERHKMVYVDSPAESIPFGDGHFDIVAALNSLDHVEDVDATIREIKRVTARDGVLLIAVELQHDPTLTEPHTLPLDVSAAFGPEFVSELTTYRDMDPIGGMHGVLMNGVDLGPEQVAVRRTPLAMFARLRRV